MRMPDGCALYLYHMEGHAMAVKTRTERRKIGTVEAALELLKDEPPPKGAAYTHTMRTVAHAPLDRAKWQIIVTRIKGDTVTERVAYAVDTAVAVEMISKGHVKRSTNVMVESYVLTPTRPAAKPPTKARGNAQKR